MAGVAIVWLSYEAFRFFLQPASIGSRPIHPGALDLKMFHSMVNDWFAGEPVYTGKMGYLYTHPPASMALIWPVYGWHAMETTVIAWTVTAAACLVWLIHLIVRQSGAETPLEQVFVALVPIAIYPTGAVIGNGQMVLQIFPCLIAGLLLIRGGTNTWRRDLWASALILLALAKPIIAAPFFWIVIFAAGSFRPAFFVVAGYLALTLFTASFQDAGTIDLLRQFLARAYVTSVRAGEANVPILLSHMGLKEWAAPASLTILFLLGIWVWRHRRDDLWLLIGVTALVARFWSYHRWYDDLLILLPMVALFRIAKSGPASRGMDVAAGLLFGFTLVFMMAPGGLYLLPTPWNGIYSIVQVLTWIADLAFLLYWPASTAKHGESELHERRAAA